MRSRAKPVTLVNALVMIVAWLLLWGTVSIPLILLGAVLTVVIGLVFPLPPINFRGSFRPHWWLAMFAHFLWDLVVSSLAVIALILRPTMRVNNAVIAVKLRVPSDLIMTHVAQLVSLVPGSVAIDLMRNRQRIYVHILDVGTDAAALEEAHQQVLDAEARMIRVLGSKIAVEQLRAEKQPEEQ